MNPKTVLGLMLIFIAVGLGLVVFGERSRVEADRLLRNPPRTDQSNGGTYGFDGSSILLEAPTIDCKDDEIMVLGVDPHGPPGIGRWYCLKHEPEGK